MKSNHMVNVLGITILKDGTWPQLKEALEPIIRDKRLTKLILVSAEKTYEKEVAFFANMYKGKVILSLEDTSSGRSYLFSKSIELAKKEVSDYVLFLEEDAIPEYNLIDSFLDNFKYFKVGETSNIIMLANTIDIFGVEKSFYASTNKKDFKDGTLFDVFSIKKISSILKRILHIKGTPSSTPIFRTQSFIGGGAFIPTEALHKVSDPDASLYMYGEDTDYAWKLAKAGYRFYQCSHPIIRKPASLENTHHVFSLFDTKTKDHEVYYHIRNAVLLSRRNTYQSKPVLLLNIISWVGVVLIAGGWETDSFKHFFSRARIITRGCYDGYFEKNKRPTFNTV